MKSTTPDCMKFRRLQRKLGVSKCQVVGILELLWIATAKNAPQGDIGKFSNEEIAIECDWEGSPDELVAALLECGWLDANDQCRLVIHDWADHCPIHVANNLRRWGRGFAVPPKDGPKEPPEDDPSEPPKEPPNDVPSKPSQAKPSLTKSSQAKPSQAKPDQTAVGGLAGELAGGLAADEFLKLAEVDAVRRDANRLLKACPMVQPATLWQIAWIGCCLDPGFVGDMLERMRNPKEPIRNRQKYLLGSVRRELESRGLDVNDCLVGVPPPPKIVEKV